MPERDGSPQDSSSAPLGDLFDNLPDPTSPLPVVESDTPTPGSRRAAREAAAAASRSPRGSDAAPASAVSTNRREETPEPPVTADRGDDTARTASRAVDEEPRQESDVAVPVAAASAERSAATSATESPSAAEEPARPISGGTLDELFDTSVAEADTPRTPKKKRRKGCLIALIVVLAVFGGIAAGGVWAWNTWGDRISDALGWGEPADWEPGLATGEAFVTINEGDTGLPVSEALFEAGVTKTDEVFYDMLVDEAIAVTFYPGVYRLQEKMTAAAALDALNNPENKLENTAGVTEGGTVASSLPSIAEGMGMPLEDFEAAVADPSVYGVDADSLEGWLFPAVYTFDPEVTAEDVIRAMVERTRESLDAADVPDEDAQRILTIASIIQREGRVADFDKVSRVIQNRLDDGMMLQMDSTAQYGYGELHEGVVSTSEEAQYDENPWNTYVIEGLPAGPIANPGDAAIDAAMHPADGPWFYFVTVNPQTGETVFSTTYEEHQQGVEQWGEWCEANPDQGC